MDYPKIAALAVFVFTVTTALPALIDISNDNNDRLQNQTAPISFDLNVVPNDSDNDDYRLPKNVVPIHYDLKFVPDITLMFTFDGEAAIKFKVLEPTSDVFLHWKSLTLNEETALLTLENGDTIKPQVHVRHWPLHSLKIHFDRTLEVGVYTLSLQFSGYLEDEMHGFFKEGYENDQGNVVWLAATQFEPISAREAFPCWDEPSLKATFDISVKHYPNCTALSNMPVYETTEVDEEDGKMWTRFERTPVMSTYLVAFVVADFEKISNEDGTINAWSRSNMLPHLKFGLDVAEKAAAELVKYTNSTVRVPKMDHVVFPHHPTGAMENWGLITYPESSFVYKDNSTLEQKIWVISTIIHELAHQWFGNVVSPTWWSYIWLNEGFASYFQHYIMDKVYPNFRIMEYFVVHVIQRSLTTDAQHHRSPIGRNITLPYQIPSIFSQPVYQKAASILHMLSNIISPEVFQVGIVKYLNEHEYKSTNSDCLWTALQSTLDKSEVPHDDFRIKEAMDTWINQRRYPLVYVTRNYSTGQMTLFQKDFALIDVHPHGHTEEASEIHEWWVPVNYATKGNPDFSNTRPTHWLKPNENLTIDGPNPDEWIIINNQQTGYYRVTYDNDNWRKIAAHLHSENFTDIHLLNRAQIISDVTKLIEHDHIAPSIFFEIVTYLSQETDYLPWYPMFDFIERVSNLLTYPTAETIKAFILQNMENLIKDVGFEEHADDDPFTILKRTETLMKACELGHAECRAAATKKLLKHLENPEENAISPNLETWVYEFGMTSANESDWNKVFDYTIKNPEENLFRSLSNTENPELFMKYLNTAMLNNTDISEENRKKMVTLGLQSCCSVPIVDILFNFTNDRGEEIGNRWEYVIFEIVTLDFRMRTTEQVMRLCEIPGSTSCESSFVKEKLVPIERANKVINHWTNIIKKLPGVNL